MAPRSGSRTHAMPRIMLLSSIVGSILTSKALIMDDLKDFPVSLLLLQMFVVTAIKVLCRALATGKRSLDPLVSSGPMVDLTALCLTSFITTARLLCSYKMLKFSGSLPTSIFLLSLSISSPCFSSDSRTSHDAFLTALRWLIFLCGFCLVLLWDFRLNRASRDMSLACLGLSEAAGYINPIAKSLKRLSCMKTQKVLSHPVPLDHWPVLATLLLAIIGERPQDSLGIPNKKTALTLFVNMGFTASAAFCSGILDDPAYLDGTWTRSLPVAVQNSVSNLAFTGTVSALSCLVPDSPAILSRWQAFGYIIALGSIGLWTTNENTLEPTQDELSSVHEIEAGDARTYKLSLSNNNRDQLEQENTSFKGTWSSSLEVVCAIMFWLLCCLTLAAVHPTKVNYPPSHLDTTLQPSVDLEVVVAAYARPGLYVAQDINGLLTLPNLQPLTTWVSIYHKGNQSSQFEQHFRQSFAGPANVTITQLDNYGREGASYLHHITTRWGDLAHQTLFVQEHTHDFTLLKQRIADYFVRDTGFMSLSYEGKLWKQCENQQAGRWPSITDSIARVSDMLHLDQVCRDIVLTFRGQFLVSGARIRSNSRDMYLELLRGMLDEDSWMHSPRYTQSLWTASPDSLADPTFGCTLERLWGTIMHCNNDNVAYRSPSLLGSYVRFVWFGKKFALEDVQCLDGDP